MRACYSNSTLPLCVVHNYASITPVWFPLPTLKQKTYIIVGRLEWCWITLGTKLLLKKSFITIVYMALNLYLFPCRKNAVVEVPSCLLNALSN